MAYYLDSHKIWNVGTIVWKVTQLGIRNALFEYLFNFLLHMRNSKDILYVEVETCTDCHLHSWCSRHDESKYIEHYDRLSTKLVASIPSTVINKNQPPPHYRRIAGKSATGESKYFNETTE